MLTPDPPGTAPDRTPVLAAAATDRPRAHVGWAWAVILLLALGTIVLNHSLDDTALEGQQQIERLLLRIQTKYIVGAARFTGDPQRVYKQAEGLDAGSLAQRQRFVLVAAELAGAAEAGRRLRELDQLIERERGAAEPFTPTPDEEALQTVLRKLYLTAEGQPVDDIEVEQITRLDRLEPGDRQLLRDDLGWLAGAALAPPGGDAAAREAFLAEARRLALVLMVCFGVLIVAGLIGLAGLGTAALFAFRGQIRSGMGARRAHHGIYAETFAVWLVLFVVLQFAAGAVVASLPALGLVPVGLGFLASLSALAWPVRRGVAWAEVRRDVGWTTGERPWLEPLIGAGGYLCALPLVGIGLLLTLLLIALQGMLGPEPAPFAPNSGPAHPIVLQLAESGWWLKLQVLLLASVAAPIVEETMFRGVLYRHLRDATSGWGTAISVLVAGMANGLIFAAIHPQGWVAIPALMALAWAFILLREWRGSILPAMVLHGISNGVVMLVLIAILGLS